MTKTKKCTPGGKSGNLTNPPSTEAGSTDSGESRVLHTTPVTITSQAISTSTPGAVGMSDATANDILTASMENLSVQEIEPMASESVEIQTTGCGSTIKEGGKRKKRNICGAVKKKRRKAKLMLALGQLPQSSTEAGPSQGLTSLEKNNGLGLANRKVGLQVPSSSNPGGGRVSKKGTQKPKGPSKATEATSHSRKAVSYSQAARKEFETIVQLVDGNITAEQSELVQHSLFQFMLSSSSISPSFAGVTLKAGKLYFSCLDMASSDWLKSAASNCSPWEGARLTAMRVSELPKTRLAKIWIPGRTESERDLMKALSIQNGMDTTKWTIQSYKGITGATSNGGTGSLLYVHIDLDSAKAIEDRNAKLNFKFGQINVKFIMAKGEK